jgi:ketosteroid isomerase-like protein
VAAPRPDAQDPVALVRALWDATRDRDIEAGMTLMHPDVEWVPLLAEGPSIRGTDALRARLDEIAGSGILA